LLGEQHDADAHQELARLSVAHLAHHQRLSALVMEMADAGRDTQGLSPQASDADVRERLHWNDAAWPWQRYGPVVMQAVRGGVPVVGANVLRSDMGAIMRNTSLDQVVPAAVLAAHRERMVESHCGLLPESQVPGMARIQIARDQLMAQTARQWVLEGKTVLLLAGAEHVKRDRGVPLMWPADVAAQAHVVWMRAGEFSTVDPAVADTAWATPATPAHDHCADMSRSMKR
jgi:uncharacterized iron-regulated protein